MNHHFVVTNKYGPCFVRTKRAYPRRKVKDAAHSNVTVSSHKMIDYSLRATDWHLLDGDRSFPNLLNLLWLLQDAGSSFLPMLNVNVFVLGIRTVGASQMNRSTVIGYFKQ